MIIIDMVNGEIETSPAQTKEQQPQSAATERWQDTTPALAPALHESTEAVSERPELHIPDIDTFIDAQD